MKQRRVMNKKRGFSLVELLVVVSIIGILSVILVPNVRENIRRAKIASTQALISKLSFAITAYEKDFGKYPPSFNPQELYLALTEKARTAYEPDSSEIKLFDSGDNFWINEENTADDRRDRIMGRLQIPSDARQAQMEEYAFIDSWGNPLYYVSNEEYNPGGRTDFRNSNRRVRLDAPCAYQMRDDQRYKPYKPSTFQIISFGPDGTTITPSTSNGGIGSMLPTDKIDNDGDDFIDNQDRVREGDRFNSDDPDVIAEDDITNFM